jgi:hypothetical protein
MFLLLCCLCAAVLFVMVRTAHVFPWHRHLYRPSCFLVPYRIVLHLMLILSCYAVCVLPCCVCVQAWRWGVAAAAAA